MGIRVREDDERDLPTQTAGDLNPPSRRPPTAVGAAAPYPEEPSRRVARVARSRSIPLQLVKLAGGMAELVEGVFRRVARKLAG